MKRILVSLAVAAFAGSVSAEPMRKERPHEHGSLNLDIAVEGSRSEIDLESPAVNIYGFEHEAKSERDKARQKDGLERIRKNLATLIQFDPSLKCSFKVESLKWVLEKAESHSADEKEGQHSVVQGRFKVICLKPIAGSTLHFGFSKIFQDFNLSKVRVQAISGDKQTGGDIENDQGSIEL